MQYLSEENIQTICNEYGKKSIEVLSKEYKVGSKRLKEILLSHNIPIINSHKKTVSCDNYIEANITRFPHIEGCRYIAKLKNSNISFDDYLNKGGALTSYIKNELHVEIPSLFLRKKYFHEHQKQWYEQWFDIISIKEEKTPTKKCPYCRWETVDINNKSGMFLTHLLKVHNITKEQYLIEHPEDEGFLMLANKTLNRQMEKDTSKYVSCAICGKKLARIDWRHLAKHGITKEEYQLKYNNIVISDALRKRLSDITTERNKVSTNNYESKAEKEIKNMISLHGFKCHKEKKYFDGVEMDIYIPKKRICIEYNGVRYHTEWYGKKNKYFHLNKLNKCKEKGVKLIHIFEDEYETKKEIVNNKILHLLGVQNNLPKIMARKCIIKPINKNIANDFLEKYHIQGGTSSTIKLGCFYNNILIGVMLFKKEKEGIWELVRFASDYHYICCGVGGKLFKYFIKNYNPIEIKSFADRRWTIDEENNIYIQLGFKFDTYSKPEYRYVNRKIDRYKRFHKFGFRKQILHKRYGLPLSMTETEMVKVLGYDRIWDCGLIRYIWKKENE